MSCALSAAGLASRFNRSVSLRPRTSARSASVLARRFRARTRGCEIRAADVDNMTSFLDEADFDAMREAMSLFDEQRDTVIKRSRDITKASKVAIYCLHRGEMDKADSQIAQALAAADELSPLVEANPQLRNSGSYSGGLEEYAEAAIFAHFIRTGTVLPSKSLPQV
jgi:hypothetical protein